MLRLLAFALNIIAISDVLRSRRTVAEKVILIVLIMALPFIGAAIYLLVLRENN
ncbi:MAG: PLDc N-terminal domain-containing protein [Acidobacteriota bacterium]|nr:PLDc N-terminal domain-containing protein [Blastocatellia bacterium]MDW8413760.1 PLDc N-terminal domain-containing protein [Acidobacteriota bacterium]